MTEAEWLNGVNPGPMRAFALGRVGAGKLLRFGRGALTRFLGRLQEGATPAASAGEAFAAAAFSYAAPALGMTFPLLGMLGVGGREELAAQCELLRELVGNPFRPVAVHPAWLTWGDGAVRKIAQTIESEERYAALPILADALEDAGCTDAELLAHCRRPGGHARGCWAVDLLLEGANL
jgi:hypothetical protein